MRLVQVAKALGMTGQQLRKELENVDFGIKPTDREIPDNLAQGVIRFVARKNNITIDMSALEGIVMDDPDDDTPRVTAAAAKSAEPEQKPVPDTLNVLRKLTLDDVPKSAVRKQAEQLSREEQKVKQEEARESSHMTAVKRAAPTVQQQIKQKTGTVTLPSTISVKEFAEKAGVQVPKVVATLMKNGIMATITQSIDYDTAALIAAELGVAVEREQESADAELLISRNLRELMKDEPENLLPRPPIVIVMGHVDHGKTSILDAIRQTDVVSRESGGITQHIGAYQVKHSDKLITFLDTPGHEAFTAMRARGAQVTDIVVLVVSAEEGPKNTTIEALNHAKEAGVPIIVALNKVDRPNANIEKVKGEMAALGLQPEDWGGTVPFIGTSAVTKQGINDLLDHILLISEVSDFKANPKRSGVATVIESHLDPALGPLASVIVNTGTLKVGDAFICGKTVGKVRAMNDASATRVEAVPPSGAVRVSGFGGVPQVGDILQVVGSEREARELLKKIMDQETQQQKRGLGDLVSMLHEGKLQQLKIVLKADTQGSLEALQLALGKQETDKVQVKVIHAAIGAVSESDVMMASASSALVLSFRSPVSPAVERTAEREGVEVRRYDVIYSLLEDVEGLLKGLLTPEEEEKILGHLEVKGVFLTKKSEQIIGGRVTDGVIKRVPFRLQRNGEQVGTGRILMLRKVDQDIKEAKADSECGLRVESSIPVEVGDVLEAFHKEFKKKED
jgi:translation initiation factor IF-2